MVDGIFDYFVHRPKKKKFAKFTKVNRPTRTEMGFWFRYRVVWKTIRAHECKDRTRKGIWVAKPNVEKKKKNFNGNIIDHKAQNSQDLFVATDKSIREFFFIRQISRNNQILRHGNIDESKFSRCLRTYVRTHSIGNETMSKRLVVTANMSATGPRGVTLPVSMRNKTRACSVTRIHAARNNFGEVIVKKNIDS